MRLTLHSGGELFRFDVSGEAVTGPAGTPILALDPYMGLGIATAPGRRALLWSGPRFGVVSSTALMHGETVTAVLQVQASESGHHVLVVSEIDLEIHALDPFRCTCRITLEEVVLEATLRDGVLETKNLAGQVARYLWDGPELRRLG